MKSFSDLAAWFLGLAWPAQALLLVLLLLALGFVGLVAYARITADRRRGSLVEWLPAREPQEGAKTLILLVPGFRQTQASMMKLARTTMDQRPDADVSRAVYPSHLFSNADPRMVAYELSEELDERSGRYEKIVLVGVSMGALIVRKAFLYGHGTTFDLPFAGAETSRRPWVTKVDRIVLLAGVNRGWSVNPKPKAMAWWKALVVDWIGKPFARLTGTARMGLAVERGSPFVANLRVDWIRRQRAPAGTFPPVIQLLHTHDDVVSSEDSKDVAVARDFIFVPVNGTGHGTILDFEDGAYGPERARKYRAAIAEGEAVIRQIEERYAQAPDPLDERTAHLVFVVHGIRDLGDWTQDLKALLAGHPEIRVERPKYGYFPMAGFLLGGDRRRYVRWFMDQYTELLAECPGADGNIDFIGHSNGTYILAGGLRDYAAMRFNRVVFAGSVVPRGYDWPTLKRRGQVRRVKNYVATGDAVVAIFPKALGKLGQGDLGSAGYEGFERLKADDEEVFIPGDHGAAIMREDEQKRKDREARIDVDDSNYVTNQRSIANFILDVPTPDRPRARYGRGLRLASKFCILFLFLIVCIVLGVGVVLTWAGVRHLEISPWMTAIVYLLFVAAVLIWF